MPVVMASRAGMAGLVLLLCVAPTSVRAQRPALDIVLSRAAVYVGHYIDELSNLAMEERYSQDVISVLDAWGRTIRANGPHRTLRSDVVLVRIGPPLEWRPFRDVFEVNDLPVRGRDDRLTQLFLEPAESAHAQALRIMQEGSRFNIGNVMRTLNQPGVPLMFLQTAVQSRFEFTLDRADRSLGADVWVVTYVERARPTVFQHNNAVDNPSSGRFWIDSETGVVRKSEHVVRPPDVNATFTTTFGGNPGYTALLPLEMTERVAGRASNSTSVDGLARYSNVRRFNVTTNESTPAQRP